jgi:hypothetical protein
MALAALLAAGCAGELDRGGPDGFVPAPAVLPRLTASQHRNTLVDVFGADLPPTAAPADTNPYLFFSIGATTTELSELGAQQYAGAAEVVSSWVTADAARAAAVLGCAPVAADDPCVESIVAEVGLRLFRRPLTGDEQAAWAQVARDTARGDALRGVRQALYGMLQSPAFLYRAELGEPDPAASTRLRYSSYEMASRLSFLLWDTAPDRELLDAAARDELVSAAGLHVQAARLLESPRARDAVQAFFAQYLDLARLDHLDRDPAVFPAFTPTIAAAMKAELRLLVDDRVFRSDDDIRTLFSSRRTFVNRELAALYGVEAPGATDVAFVPVELPADGPRAGILTSAGLLAMNAHLTETSPTRRGKFLRERILCQKVQEAGDEVDLTIDPPDGVANTLRERLERHVTDPSCQGCHAFIDPPGYLFEHFDPIGAYRTEDNGYPIDATGDLDGLPMADARDLGEALAADRRVTACMVTQLYRHASGRLELPDEAPVLADLERAFAASGYRFQDLLVELVMSAGFRTVAREVAP